MKNFKNTFAAVMMMAVMVFGTTFANAGIIIARNADGAVKSSDTKTTSTSTCDEPQSDLVGIIAKDSDSGVVNCGIIIA